MADPKNIYSNSVAFLASQQKESNKISYWLEKLFDQEKEKNKEISDNLQHQRSLNINVKQDFVDERARNLESDRRVISDMTQSSNEILMSTNSVFPFDFFPTTINIEVTRVAIITRQLFSSQVHSVDIKDISSVFIETSILFAAITLISKTYSQKELVIDRLWKKDAILLRRIIEGLRMFEKRGVNTTNFSRAELLSKLKELSATKIVL